MSVTGTQVSAQVDVVLSDTSKWTATQKLGAINAAIAGAWPQMKAVSVDSSITLDADTFEYTPSATPEVEWGFSQAYVTVTSNPKVLLYRIKQRQNGTGWTIIVPPDIAGGHNDQTLHLLYNSRVARIAALTDSIELPFDYLWNATAYYLCLNALSQSSKFEARAYEPLLSVFKGEKEKSAMNHQRGNLQRLISNVAELGGVGNADWQTFTVSG